jgi:DNA-binding CsgD family transcriptional regulator
MNVFTDLDRPLVRRPGDAEAMPPRKQRPARVRPLPNVFPEVVNPWRLTAIECEVMRRAVLLQTYQEVGTSLNRSPKTIEAHSQRAWAKMGAKNLMHAVLMWDRRFRAAA